ncbi:YoaK family protein [Lachnoclostridium edouardi]|uniref:YoaK family protein n=1 Tax=Lachnoclostridium edouardi TaxID=1926283 RepID=UPI000C7961B9|nr:YoaK family protein [Lachnoclostridium edouardi]
MRNNATNEYLLGAMLAFTSGFLDCYTFMLHGGAFATMQTGNLIQAVYNFVERNCGRAIYFWGLNIVFLVTTFVTKWTLDILCNNNELKWKRYILQINLIIMVGLGGFYSKLTDFIVNASVSVCAAMQYCAFRTFANGSAYATVFCTGNMRSLVDNGNRQIIMR